MSDFTHSTLTSPRSPLFSDSDTPERQSGSEIVTSDEEPDLGAFTTVLRFWGHLQPPIRIPTHFPSSSSSRTRSTPTTITGYPGFGGNDSETVEESTVWNRIPIQSYFRPSFGTETSSSRTELARESLLEELDDEEFMTSPPPSPASDGARTVEIASEVDAASVTFEDGASGERLVVPVATPPSIDERTVSVASGAESQDEQTVPQSFPIIINDNTLSSLSSASPILSTRPYSISIQPPDDNTTISRHRTSPSTISVVSYQQQMSAPHTQPSIFQESPSSRPESGTTSFSPHNALNVSRPSTRRVVSNSSHTESDIINSYYAQGPNVLSPSTDQPVLDFPRPRRLEILAQPLPGSNQQPWLEQDSPLPDQRRPSIVDDNSSTSALTEDTLPPSLATSSSASVLQEMQTDNSESPIVHSSHFLTSSRKIILPTISSSTSSSTSTTRTTATVTANHTRHSSLDSISFSRQFPSFASTYREQQPRIRPRLVTSVSQEMQTPSSYLHYHSLSSEGDPSHEQPSLGYLDEALSFIAAERARWTAAREAGLHRGSSPQSVEERHVSESGGAFQQGGTWRYAIEPQCDEKPKRIHRYKGYKSLTAVGTPASSHIESLSSQIQTEDRNTIDTNAQLHNSSTVDHLYSASDNVIILRSPQKSHKKAQTNFTFPNNEIRLISILKRPEISGHMDATMDTNGVSSSNLNLNNNNTKYSHSHATTHCSAPSSMLVGERGVLSSTTKFDASLSEPRAHPYLYSSTQDTQDNVKNDEYEEGNGKGKESAEDSSANHSKAAAEERGEDGWYIDKYGKRRRRFDLGFHHRTQSADSVHKSIPNTSRYILSRAQRCAMDSGMRDDPEGDRGCDGGQGGELATDKTYKTEVVEEDEEEEDRIFGGRIKKGSLKKKKAKKRKIPVTGRVPMMLKSSLSHSHSVPNLRSEAERTCGSLTDSAAEDGSRGQDGSSDGFPISGKVGALIPSASFPKISGSKKGKQSSNTDPFVLRGDPLHVTSWQANENGFAARKSKRSRLVTLARYLRTLFPEEQEYLGKVVDKLDPPFKGSDKKQKKKKGGKPFLDDCSLDYSSLADSDLQRAQFDEEDPDPRGDIPGKKDTLVHIFIDHSNILIGFLTHLKRMSRKFKRISSAPKPQVINSGALGTSRASGTSVNSASRPLPIPRTKAGIPILDFKPLIPLPSFATANLFCSVSATPSAKNGAIRNGDGNDQFETGDGSEDDVPFFEFDDKAHGYANIEGGTIEEEEAHTTKTMAKLPLHLWHAALALVLERGRPVTRRYVVASRPLHQPMESIERLDYEVSVLTRVPDFGDGADRVEKATKQEQHSKDNEIDNRNGSPTKGILFPFRQIGGKNHTRRISTTNASGEVDLAACAGSISAIATSSGHQPHQMGSARVKYREQGVDEVLQLKLLTTITATDNVPEGATIVLATGDGNVGQFNEEGYLGPVRNALKNGWKVELYAWEDGLSRSWRREFGPTSEWGKRGMFRVIAMEQFAEYLVDLG